MVLRKLGIVIIDLECRGEGDCLKPELTTEGFLVLSLHFFFIGYLPATAIVGMILNIMHNGT